MQHNTLATARKRRSKNRSSADCVERIEALTRTARSAWLGLLFFLTFVVLALMGVKDVDFFLSDKNTSLPFVGISIPTFLFFALTPLAGSILYAYFHMHLVKLWGELADAPCRVEGRALSDQIFPWLVSDLALAYRQDGALRHRPLMKISHYVNSFLAFWATPLVLIAFWYWSAAPHFEWLTLLACGLPLIFSIYVGTASWQHLKTVNARYSSRKLSKLIHRSLLCLIALIITTAGWLRVEGTFTNYALAFGVDREKVETSWLGSTPFPNLLYAANLSGVNFAQVPENWMSRSQFRSEFRKEWCRSVGIPEYVCGPAPIELFSDASETEVESVPKAMIELLRRNYCLTVMGPNSTQSNCIGYFDQYDQQFEADWREARHLAENALASFDFQGADLRNARMTGAYLQGADFTGALLDGADLSYAEMQGTVFFQASLKGAKLIGSQAEEADFEGAVLDRADLWQANLQGAVLEQATLVEADLSRAKLQTAQFWGADLKRAIFDGAELQAATLFQADLSAASMRDTKMQGAGLTEADLSGADLTAAQLQGALLSRTQLGTDTKLSEVNFNGTALRQIDLRHQRLNFSQAKGLFADQSVRFSAGLSSARRFNKVFDTFREFETGWRTFQAVIGQNPNDPD